MSVAAALLAILFATPATAPAAPSAPCSADCSDSTAEAGEPSTDLPTTDLPAIDESDVPDAPSTDNDSATGTDTETDGDDGSGSVVVPTPPETGDGGDGDGDGDGDDDDADIGGGIGGIGGIGGGGGDSGTGGGTGSTDTDSGTGDFGESARVTITNDPDDNPVIRPDRPTPDAPAANAPSASGPQDSTAGVPVAPSLPGTSPNRATPKPPTSDRDRAPATATEVPVEPAVTTAAPSLTSQDFAAAGTGIAGLILIAGAAGAMTYRNARAGRVRVNAARAEFLSPGGR